MIYQLSNSYIMCSFSANGAELVSLKVVSDNQELLWQAEPEVWARHAPVLFPIVGKMRNNTYTYKGATYSLPQHGFARDFRFDVSKNSADSIVFQLDSSDRTLVLYPFSFSFFVSYSLNENELITNYRVVNKGYDLMYFSVGAHPGFNIPSFETHSNVAAYLTFSSEEHLKRMMLKNGLLETAKPIPPIKELAITPVLFKDDALVFTDMISEKITLRKEDGSANISVSLKGWPYLGLWAKPGANFICIEPWVGHADLETHNGDLTQKSGMIALEAGGTFDEDYTISVGE